MKKIEKYVLNLFIRFLEDFGRFWNFCSHAPDATITVEYLYRHCLYGLAETVKRH